MSFTQKAKNVLSKAAKTVKSAGSKIKEGSLLIYNKWKDLSMKWRIISLSLSFLALGTLGFFAYFSLSGNDGLIRDFRIRSPLGDIDGGRKLQSFKTSSGKGLDMSIASIGNDVMLSRDVLLREFQQKNELSNSKEDSENEFYEQEETSDSENEVIFEE